MPRPESSRFLEFVRSFAPIPEDMSRQFAELVTVRKFRKKELVIHSGGSPDLIVFVVSGLFRYYYTSLDGTEYTKGFFRENSVLSAYDAILENKPAYYSIQALEDSVAETVYFSKLRHLMEKHPAWDKFLIALLQKGYLVKVRRERELLLLDAKQRYHSFLEQYPGLEKRVSQQMIASFIGITPESLSRIRKKSES